MKRWLAFIPALDVRRDRAKIFGILFALLGLNFLVYLGVILPRNRELSRLRGSIERLDGQIDRWKRIVDEQVEALARVERTRSRMTEFFDRRLSSKQAKMTSILREIRSIAKKFKIDPESIQYNHEMLEDQGLVQFEMTVPLIGSYSRLRQFLNRVETSDHFLFIDRITLSGSKEGGARLTLNIKLVTYFSSLESPPPQEAAAAADEGEEPEEDEEDRA